MKTLIKYLHISSNQWEIKNDKFIFFRKIFEKEKPSKSSSIKLVILSLRDGFKTQLAVDRPEPAVRVGCHCPEQ